MQPRRTTNLDESQRPAIPSLGAVSRRQEVRYLDPLVVGRHPGKAVPCKRVHKTGPGAMDPKSAISVHCVAERIERFRFPSKAPVNRYLARSIVPPAVNLLNHTHLSGDVLQRKGDGKELYHSFRGGWLAGLEEHVLHREIGLLAPWEGKWLPASTLQRRSHGISGHSGAARGEEDRLFGDGPGVQHGSGTLMLTAGPDRG